MTILKPEEAFVLQLFNLDNTDVQSVNYRKINDMAYVDIKLTPQPICCPECGYNSPKVKSYVSKKINHSVLNDRSCTIAYHARRYVCPLCKRTFYESNPFVFNSMKISSLTVYNVLSDLKDFNETFSSVARRHHISPTSAASIFDSHIKISRAPLPSHINFDEVYAFRSKDSKYVCVLLDYLSQKPIDVLPSRQKQYLIDYFYKIPLEERKKVKYVCFDMWETYRDVAKLMFPNSIASVDRFHIMQDLHRRLDRIRIRVMKGYQKGSDGYYLLKNFNWILFKRDDSLLDPNNEKKYNYHFRSFLNYYDISLKLQDVHPDLKASWILKDAVVDFYDHASYENAGTRLNKIIQSFLSSNIEEMAQFGYTMMKWKNEIINSFLIVGQSYKVDHDTGEVIINNKKMNNGIIENRNKIIKCIKHNSNGYTNWVRFRNRLLYVLDPDSTFHLYPIQSEDKKHD